MTPDTWSWWPQSLVDLAGKPPEPPTIIGVFYANRRHLLYGAAESLKTWLAAIAAADRLRDGAHVVWVDVDGGTSGELLERFRQLGVSDAGIHVFLHYISPDEALKTDEAGELVEFLASKRPELVVIDSATGSMAQQGLDPNVAVDVENWWQNVADMLSTNGAAIVVIDHTGANPDMQNRAAGSVRKIQAPAVALSVTKVDGFGRGRTGRSKIVVRKDRPGFHPPTGHALGVLVLESNPDTGRVTWRIERTMEQPKAFRPTRLMQRVSEHLEALGESVPHGTLVHDVTGNSEHLRAAIAALLAQGSLTELRVGNARMISLSKPYREADDPLSDHYSPTRPSLAQSLPMGKGSQVSPTRPSSLEEGEGEYDQADLDRMAVLYENEAAS